MARRVLKGRGVLGNSRVGEGATYVRPVERRTPARKADTGSVSWGLQVETV